MNLERGQRKKTNKMFVSISNEWLRTIFNKSKTFPYNLRHERQ